MNPTDLLEVVEARVPGWRESRPHRLSTAARWPTLARRVGDRSLDVCVLPGVGTEWVARGGRYWLRRTGFTAFLLAVAAAFGAFDVAFIRLAARGGSGTPFGVAVVVLAVAGAVFYWRPDLAATPRPGPERWLRLAGAWVLVVLGGIGRLTTPTWVLGQALDQLPRFPVQERRAWQLVVAQRVSPATPPAARRQ